MVSPAWAEDTIKLGGLYNLTGGMSSIDAPALNGAKLQAKLINAKGGVLGKKLEVIGIDTKTDQKAAATGAQKALSMGVVAGTRLRRHHLRHGGRAPVPEKGRPLRHLRGHPPRCCPSGSATTCS